MTPESDVVVRELTARGRGGVSVVEVRGVGALSRVARLVPGGAELGAGSVRVARLTSGDESLDEALVWVESDALVELHLHGAPPIVERITRELGAEANDGSPAGGTPGAQSLEERAFERLAAAPTEAAARVLLDQAEGALRRELESIVARLRSRDSDRATPGQGGVDDLGSRVARLAAAGDRHRYLFEPPLVVLAGPVNAGKSTLFNVLVGRERVVVDAERGTTRDAVRERVSLGAYAVDLVDTAGERDLGADPVARVEHAGQLLGRSLREAADLVLWLAPRQRTEAARPTERFEATRAARPGHLQRTLTSRADELSAEERSRARAPISSSDPDGMRRVVRDVVHGALGLAPEPWDATAPNPSPVPFEPALSEALQRIAAGLAGAGPDPRDVAWLETELLR